MISSPKKVVLTTKPDKYLKQGFSHCGVYSVKAILEAYGLNDKKHPKNYHTNWLGKITGWTMGRNYYNRVLSSYGLNAKRKDTKGMSDNERISLLKSLLSKDTPVMLRIGNGYLSDKYNPIVGKLLSHWITLWGYDDKEQLFYIYDSALPEKFRLKDIPIGNTVRTYKEILRDWNFGTWQFWYWLLFPSGSHLYIEVNKR